MWEIIIPALGLCLVIGGGVFSYGHKSGKTDQKVDEHTVDIDNLWEFARDREAEFIEHTQKVENKLGKLEATAEATSENVNDLKTDIRDIRNAVIGGKR